MKSKKIIIITIAILYGLLSFLLFSETLITQLIEVRKEYHISQSRNFEQFNFTKPAWQNLKNKKEFRHNGDYYDVKKISIKKNSVIVTVIKDKYENPLKFIYKNISPKNKKNKASEIKRIFDVDIPKTVFAAIRYVPKETKHTFYYISSDITSHLPNIFRPPCIVQNKIKTHTNTKRGDLQLFYYIHLRNEKIFIPTIFNCR